MSRMIWNLLEKWDRGRRKVILNRNKDEDDDYFDYAFLK